MTVNRATFINQLVSEHNFTKKAATLIVDSFWDVVEKNLANGNTVAFKGFGKFDIVNRKQRVARNPQTGELCKVPEYLVPRFYPGVQLKNAVRRYMATANGRRVVNGIEKVIR